VSIVEIYNERIKDLLDVSKDDLKIVKSKITGTIIQNVTEYLCQTEEEVFELIDIGNKNRAIGCNKMNDKSSRSHTILTLTLVMTNIKEGTS